MLVVRERKRVHQALSFFEHNSIVLTLQCGAGDDFAIKERLSSMLDEALFVITA